MAENKFKTKTLIPTLREMFPECFIFHLDPNEIQGVPDLLVLYRDRWAVLEAKDEATASHRPNQDYYVDVMNGMSFAAFIFPENMNRVLDELDLFFNY